MAMPKAQHFDNAVGFFDQVEDAIGAFEDWELLSLRVSRVAKIAASSSGAGSLSCRIASEGRSCAYCSPRSG